MSPQEFDDRFDVLFNNITSNQAPGLNAYEKSLFLTKAQDEIVKNYFLPQSNPKQAGFDGNQKRQIDFSSITKVAGTLGKYTYTETPNVTDAQGNTTYTRVGSSSTDNPYYTQAYGSDGKPIEGHYVRTNVSTLTTGDSLFDKRGNTRNVTLPDDIMMIVNEKATVNRGNQEVILTVKPITYEEYDRLMSKPFKRPLKYQAWRLIINESGNKADIIIGPNDSLSSYLIRYIKRPDPIIVSDLDGLTINGIGTVSGCELDPILHEEILQRAVELAKVAWTSTGQDNYQAVIQAGQRSE